MERFVSVASLAVSMVAIVLSVRDRPDDSSASAKARNLCEESGRRVSELDARVQQLERGFQSPLSALSPPTVSPNAPSALVTGRAVAAPEAPKKPTVVERVRFVQKEISLNPDQEKAFTARLLEEDAVQARYLDGKVFYHSIVEERRKTDFEMSRILPASQLRAYSQIRRRSN